MALIDNILDSDYLTLLLGKDRASQLGLLYRVFQHGIGNGRELGPRDTKRIPLSLPYQDKRSLDRDTTGITSMSDMELKFPVIRTIPRD